MKNSKQSKSMQLIWGGALILMGIGVFFRVPHVMPRLAESGLSTSTIGFFRVCIYVMGVILIGGGVKKVINHFKPDENGSG